MSRTRPLRRALVATTAALAVPLAVAPLAGAASAAEVTLADARGDVWQPNEEGMDDRDAPFWKPAPEVSNGDLTKVTFSHTAKRVVVKARYVELDKPRGETIFAVLARDNAKVKWSMGVAATKRRPAGESSVVDRRDEEIPCAGFKHVVDYRKDQITLSLPRTCVEDPRWLQFKAFSYDAEFTRRSFSMYVDNPHNTKAQPKGWTKRVKVG